MGALKRIRYYLVHSETGQRYPVVNEDVVIGRNSGDILFNEDPKLSAQHCRLVMMPGGLGIHDLDSANGTYVDGTRLGAEKVYALRAGVRIQAGAQEFQLIEAFKKRKPRKRRGHRRNEAPFPWSLFFIVIIATIALVRYWPLRRADGPMTPVTLESPYSMIDKEFRAVVEDYKQMGAEVQSRHIEDKELARRLRENLLPAFKRVQSRLWAVKSDREVERRQLDLNRRIAEAVIGQLTAMEEQAEIHSPKSATLLKKYSQDLEKLSEESRLLKGGDSAPQSR
jgi:hypothetical protein